MFRPGYLAPLVRMKIEKLLGCRVCTTTAITCRIKTLNQTFQAIAEILGPAYSVASCSEGLLKKLFPYCDKLTYVFDGDRAIGRFDETSIDMRFNKLIEYDGFEMPNGNEEFPSVYSQGIDMSHEGVRALQPSHV
ncbi:retrotransposon protein [Cucumis melo var. makuwa]|uniref:Retrotransposon protein n=1 Tax=Cucumis melo var. makuwa TaxID=1194695 RepID=A0A5A7SZG0_CUCMM|nr:retrotransposon protein [Cucumis melo var. makuwa]